MLDATIVNIALPSAQAALGITDDQRQWVVTGYALAFGSLLLLGGRLSDYFGRRRMFVIGVVGFAAASALGGAAQGFETLLSARALEGAFGALLAASGLAFLTGSDLDSSYLTGVLPGLIATGMGIGFVFGSEQNAATSGVAGNDSGVASAMVNTGQQIGGATDPAVMAGATLSGYHAVFWTCAVPLVGATAAAALFRSGPLQVAPDAEPVIAH